MNLRVTCAFSRVSRPSGAIGAGNSRPRLRYSGEPRPSDPYHDTTKVVISEHSDGTAWTGIVPRERTNLRGLCAVSGGADRPHANLSRQEPARFGPCAHGHNRHVARGDPADHQRVEGRLRWPAAVSSAIPSHNLSASGRDVRRAHARTRRPTSRTRRSGATRRWSCRRPEGDVSGDAREPLRS